MAKQLAGRTAWVTGSSRGIGQSIARRLAEAGAAVAIHGSSATSSDVFGEGNNLADVAAAIADATGSPTTSVVADLTDPLATKTALSEVEAALGPIDILVAAAGGDIGTSGVRAPHAGKIQVGNDAINLSDEDIQTIWQRNFLTCVNACKATVPGMIERGSGWVVTIGSIAGLFGGANSVIYSSAKAAVHEYTRCLAAQLRPLGIQANCVAPGDILSERFQASRPLDPDRMGQDGLVRYGALDDIAAVVEFLVSPEARYITGQVIRVDGGLQLWPV